MPENLRHTLHGLLYKMSFVLKVLVHGPFIVEQTRTKRAAKVICDTRDQVFSVISFRLQWVPLYGDAKIAKCCLAYTRIKNSVPEYIEDSLKLNSDRYTRSNYPR